MSDENRKAQRQTGEAEEGEPAVGSVILAFIPGVGILLSLVLGILLLGGVSLIAAGGVLIALSVRLELALLILGGYCLILASLLAQIASRRGLL